MNSRTKWFWGIVLAQAAFLLAWAGYHETVRQTAPVLLLKGRPVDPQDLLRGDYMTMNYDISTVSLHKVPAKPGRGAGDLLGSEVWVLLEPRDGYYVVARADRERLPPNPAQVLVRGTIGYNRWDGDVSQVNYGIERYYVPEGKGSPRFQKVEVEVTVSRTHQLSIKRVLLDGKAYP